MTRAEQIARLNEIIANAQALIDELNGVPADAPAWQIEEYRKYGMNGPIFVYGAMYEKFEREFETYWDMRKEWPGISIVGDEMLAPGKGCRIYY